MAYTVTALVSQDNHIGVIEMFVIILIICSQGISELNIMPDILGDT